MKINENLDAWRLLRRAPSDPAAAAGALKIVAGYLRREEPLPASLGNWLAKAIERMLKMHPDSYAKELTDALHLTAKNRRPVGDWLLIGAEFEELIGDGSSQAKAKAKIADQFEIDERTARRYWRKYLVEKAIHDAIE